MQTDSDTDREPEHIEKWNDAAPPNAAQELAREYARSLGSAAAEQWGDNWYDLYKTETRPHWRAYYGTMAKLLHDAAKEERALEEQRAELRKEAEAA